MCQNFEATAAATLTSLEPLEVKFMTLENVPAATQTEVMNAYNAAVTALESWTPGAALDEVVQAVNAADEIFNTLPVPPADQILAGIISAGFTGVVTILEANESKDKASQAEIVAHTITTVNAKAPGYFHYRKGILAEFGASPQKQVHDAWNKEVSRRAAADPKYAALKVD